MLKLGNFFVLLIYVLGAHALPFVHQLQHVRHFHLGDAGSTVAVDATNHDASCAGYHHFPRLRSRKPLIQVAAKDARLVAAPATLQHDCGPACAACLASNAPSGFVTQHLNVFGERLPFVAATPIEPAQLLSDVCGNLPGQRGPPAVVRLKSLLA